MKKKSELIYQYDVIFDPNGDGYTVTVPKLPGLVTEGDNLQEAREMAKDAIRCHLEGLLKDKIFIMPRVQVMPRKERIKVGV